MLVILLPSELDIDKLMLMYYVPDSPGNTRHNWKRNPQFGKSAPTEREFFEIHQKYDYRCIECGSQYRICIDHADGNNKNHDLDNLQVLCTPCNMKKEGQTHGKKALVILEFFSYMDENKSIPNRNELNARVESKYGISNILKSRGYVYNYCVFRCKNPRRNSRIDLHKKLIRRVRFNAKILDINLDTFALALASGLTPNNPSSTANNWSNDKIKGYTSPNASVFRKLLIDSDYECETCQSILRLTFDHKDENPKNHEQSNLAVLCQSCNRGRSKTRKVTRPHFKVTVFHTMVRHYLSNKQLLELKELTSLVGGNLGSQTYTYHYLVKRLAKVNL